MQLYEINLLKHGDIVWELDRGEIMPVRFLGIFAKGDEITACWVEAAEKDSPYTGDWTAWNNQLFFTFSQALNARYFEIDETKPITINSAKRKELMVCHCKICRKSRNGNANRYKQDVYRYTRRKVRHATKQQLRKLQDLNDFTQVLISGGYTD